MVAEDAVVIDYEEPCLSGADRVGKFWWCGHVQLKTDIVDSVTRVSYGQDYAAVIVGHEVQWNLAAISIGSCNNFVFCCRLAAVTGLCT